MLRICPTVLCLVAIAFCFFCIFLTNRDAFARVPTDGGSCHDLLVRVFPALSSFETRILSQFGYIGPRLRRYKPDNLFFDRVFMALKKTRTPINKMVTGKRVPAVFISVRQRPELQDATAELLKHLHFNGPVVSLTLKDIAPLFSRDLFRATTVVREGSYDDLIINADVIHIVGGNYHSGIPVIISKILDQIINRTQPTEERNITFRLYSKYLYDFSDLLVSTKNPEEIFNSIARVTADMPATTLQNRLKEVSQKTRNSLEFAMAGTKLSVTFELIESK